MHFQNHRFVLPHRTIRWRILIAGALLFSGCAPEPQPAEDQTAPAAPVAVTRDVPARKGELKSGENWEIFHIQGAKVGYGHVDIQNQNEEGREVCRIDTVTRLQLSRFGQTSNQEVRMTSVETPTGELLHFETKIMMGPTPLEVRGQVADGHLELETTSAGNTVTTKLPWSSDIGGFYAIERVLAGGPMKPGERRRFKALLALINTISDVELVAGDVESTRLLDGSRRLQRIESTATLPSGSMKSVLWVDESGEILKTETDAMEQVTYRATKEMALAEASEPVAFDLGTNTIVPADRPIDRPKEASEIRYRVTLNEGSPTESFSSSVHQKVVPQGEHSAELVVRAARIGSAASGAPSQDAPATADDSQPNSMIQSDDPALVELAKTASGGETDPLRIARALEKFVHDNVTSKNFSTAFATAADVARTREGDCTEHAVLLAALARACGIPARVAIGLVYIPGLQGFGFHMWDELYIDGAWVPVDGTLGLGGVTATHIKLAHSNLKGALAYSSLLPVAQVIGRLKVEVISIKFD